MRVAAALSLKDVCHLSSLSPHCTIAYARLVSGAGVSQGWSDLKKDKI